MKKLIGARKERVNKLAEEYLTYKKLADNAQEALKKELAREDECETDEFVLRYKQFQRNVFSKEAFIEKFGQEAYDSALVAQRSRRFNLTRKK